jgi:hypothetical protein
VCVLCACLCSSVTAVLCVVVIVGVGCDVACSMSSSTGCTAKVLLLAVSVVAHATLHWGCADMQF